MEARLRWLVRGAALLALVGCPKAEEPEADVASAPAPVDTVEPGVDVADVTGPVDTGPPDPPDFGGGEDTPDVPDVAEVLPPPDPGPPPECVVGDDCKDFDNCTMDVCADGVCAHPPVPGCCVSDAECDDGVACTVDKCNLSKQDCLHTFEDNLCCLSAADCGDGDQCTQDLCAANRCVFPRLFVPGCECGATALCDDGNPCTTESCAGGECTYALIGASGACCGADADCAGGGFGACQAGLCWDPAPGCASDEDCGTPTPCLVGACQDGSCGFSEAAPDCCEGDFDCAPDGSDETTASCVGGGCVQLTGAPTPCTADADCGAPGPCASVTCHPTAGVCTWAPTGAAGCCQAASDCPKPGDACEVAICAGWTCGTQLLGELQPYWTADFDAGDLQGWTVNGDGTNAKWQISGAQSQSGGFSLYYGQLPQKDFDVGTTSGAATSPLITPASGAVVVRFDRNVAAEPITSKDLFWLEVVVGAQKTSTEVWNKNTAGGPGLGWKTVDVDVSAIALGQPFQLRFQFDSVDGVSNHYEGIYVDTVRVGVPCE